MHRGRRTGTAAGAVTVATVAGVVAATLVLALLPLEAALAAGAPSVKPDMPPEILSWREVILPTAAYVDLATQWRGYLDAHPQSAVAHVELARALRYADAAPVADRHALLERAYEIDPDCPEALDAIAGTALHSGASIPDGLEAALRDAERAIELAPEWPEPHVTAYTLCLALDRQDEAPDHLRAILDQGGFPTPLLDFAYNLLMSVEPRGILLTNGDNDTFPLLALQAARQIRTDVAVVNLSLLNDAAYARTVWKHALGDDAPFTAGEIRALYARAKSGAPGTDSRPGTVIVRELLDRVKGGRCPLPVYFAITVAPSNLAVCELKREIDGVAWRVRPEAATGGADAEPAVDFERTARHFQREFRLDSATDLAYAWPEGSAVRRLMQNYPATLHLLAGAAAARGDLETARVALRDALEILDFHGETDLARRTAAYWRELEPHNREVQLELERWAEPDE